MSGLFFWEKGNMQQPNIDLAQINKMEAHFKHEMRRTLDSERIFFYAESLKVPWSGIYNGKLPIPP